LAYITYLYHNAQTKNICNTYSCFFFQSVPLDTQPTFLDLGPILNLLIFHSPVFMPWTGQYFYCIANKSQQSHVSSVSYFIFPEEGINYL